MNKIEYGTEFLDQLKDKVHEQQWEIDRLNNIINKAIEYIEQQRLHKFQDTTGGLTCKERKLLDILEGEDNE